MCGHTVVTKLLFARLDTKVSNSALTLEVTLTHEKESGNSTLHLSQKATEEANYGRSYCRRSYC